MTTECRYIFMGTPAFAVTVLDAFIGAFGNPIMVVTQPDRPYGRRGFLKPSEIKQYALDHEIEVLTPERLAADDVLEHLAERRPDIIITAAYGRLLPLALLALPQFGCLNVHASLLPKYRGASPITAAILNGDQETGITIMQMDQGLDTGPILAQGTLALADTDTTGSLSAKLAQAAGPLLVDTVNRLLLGQVTETPQEDDGATLTKTLTRGDGALDFSESAVQLERRVRAMQPWPRAYARLQGTEIKVERAAVLPESHPDVLPGMIVGLNQAIDLACGQGTLRLLEIVPAGRKKMPAAALAHNLTLGEVFENG